MINNSGPGIFSGRYFNWDYNEDRQALLAGKWHDDDGLIVFDELHKYKNWKNYSWSFFAIGNL